jgi:hypothetical protein
MNLTSDLSRRRENAGGFFRPGVLRESLHGDGARDRKSPEGREAVSW